jgi:ferric-dicitrate binding protein FerR (iron transport regulator)
MTTPDDKAELLDLIWALCDGSLTAEQRDRLEAMLRGDAEARRRYAMYMGMIHTLRCERLPQREARRPPLADVPPLLFAAPPRRRRRKRLLAVLLAGALAAAVLLVVWKWLHHGGNDGGRPVAALTGADACRWESGIAPNVGGRLRAGKLALEEGLAEITFDSGAVVLLEGPALFEVKSAGSAVLHRGKMTARVPGSAAGFTVQTPRGVVDTGTEYGIIADASGPTDVYTFVGPVGMTPGGTDAVKQVVPPGQAMRFDDDGATPIDADSTIFVRHLPTPPISNPHVREMRELVVKHPKLLHHYTFDGDHALGEHLLDRKGGANLREMAFGAGTAARIRYGPGADPYTTAFTPHRTGPTSGGAGLVTRNRIQFPDRLTVESLICPGYGCDEGYAVSARSVAAEQRGYFIRKIKNGPYLSCTIGDSARDITMPVRFMPDHWYYVATTCQRDGNRTIVNFYVANVTAGQATLTHVGGGNQIVSGTYGKEAYLRLGMGLSANGVPRAAFSGSIADVAIYGDVLTQAELQQRLSILLEDAVGREPHD